MVGLLVTCRAGFEPDLAAELDAESRACGATGQSIAVPGTALVVFVTSEARRLQRDLRLDELVFARELLRAGDRLDNLPPAGRAGPIADAIASLVDFVDGVRAEAPDSEVGRTLWPLCRQIERPVGRALEERGLVRAGAPFRAHAVFVSGQSAYPAVGMHGNCAHWPMGIPRLRNPRDAPSRSTLKLDEAFQVLLSADERARWLHEGQSAVDLGAAPGGWTYQLVRRGMRVTAVDRGRLDRRLLEAGAVEHLLEDAFTYRPKRPVDWLVCDVVEQPRRIADLVARWAIAGWCRRAIFNLKLPMKRRYQEVCRSRALIADRLEQAGIRHGLRFKQLYHDRDEVTGLLALA